MSEEAKPVCVHCALPIHGTAYGCEGEWRHFNPSICSVAQIREIDRLRAAHEALLRRTQSLETALDQERAKVAALREVIDGSGEWLPNSRGKLIFQFGGGWIANDETLALLSGRGEAES